MTGDAGAGLPLRDLLRDVPITEAMGPASPMICGVEFDSRKARPGTLFVAIPGGLADGHDYIEAVVSAGATAILCERLPPVLAPDVAYVCTQDTRRALGDVAHVFFGHPSRELVLVGVTGTNGKTTTATLLYRLFSALGHKSGLLSTIRNYVGDEVAAATHTTGDPLQIAGLMRRMVDVGCTHCFMEVTSIAVDQHRIVGLDFDGGVFTNLTHDHLDYHHTMEAYQEAKKAFFDGLPDTAFALANRGDAASPYMLADTAARRLTYGDTDADIPMDILRSDMTGLRLRIDGLEVRSPLVGRFNAENLCAVFGAASALGLPSADIGAALSALSPPEGRMERLDGPHGVTAVIDFAHTPDALQKALETLRASEVAGDLVCVVGCGGDRDADKRPTMAAIAASLADRVILTTDNPRGEDPQAIVDAMLSGVPSAALARVTSLLDRRDAIATACGQAREGSVVLIAGKGHEKYQEVAGERRPFDDVAVAREALGA